MLRRASIYDASQPDAEDQLLFYFGNGDRNSQLREIGVAQGLCELCESFENSPVRWVKTAHESLVLQQLEKSETYPKGVWIFVACDATNIPILTAQVRDSYRQFRLLQGTFEYCHKQKINFKRWWHDFFESWEPSLVANVPGYLRVGSGVLSPDVGKRLAELGATLGADDIAVFSLELECLFSGYKFPTQVYTDVQAWAQPRLRVPEKEEAAWSISSYIPSVAMPSMSLPSMGLPSMSMPSMPSMMPSMMPSIPSMPSMSVGIPSWFSGAEAQELAPNCLRQLVMIDDTPHHLLVLAAHELVYVFISAQELSVEAEALGRISKDILGISFARDPPTDFKYLALNHESRTSTATLSAATEPELVAGMIGSDASSTMCRSRWFKHAVYGALEVVLCRQAHEMDWGLEGEDEWVRGFARRRGIKNSLN